MRIVILLIALLLVLLCLCACGSKEAPAQQGEVMRPLQAEDKPKTIIDAEYDKQAMAAAINRARLTVEIFIDVLASGEADQYAVKLLVKDGEKIEHFWLSDISLRQDVFHGVINNEAGIVSNVSLGDKHSVHKADISDWLYMKDGKMHGNFTVRPLLKHMPAKDAAHLKSILADEPVAD